MTTIRSGGFVPSIALRTQSVAEHKKEQVQQSQKQQNLRHEIVRNDMKELAGAAAELNSAADASPAAQLQSFIEASDNMAMLMGQFRSRRDFDKKADQSSDHFERVLDEDAQPKAQQILKAAKVPGIAVEDLLRHARSLFPDISDLIIVLRELLRRRQLDAVAKARLEKALAQAESEAPPRAMKAGINIALKARLFGAKLALSAMLLRASYRQFLENEDAPVMMYEEWITAYGHERRALVMEFLESALVADMLAQDPSCSRIEFGNLLGKLNELKLLRSSESLFIDTLLKDPVIGAHNGREADWLVFMLALMQSPEEIDALLMDVLGEQVLLSSHAIRSRLLQTVRHACKALPTDLFVDPDAVDALWERFAQLAAVTYRHELIELRTDLRRRSMGGGSFDEEDDADDTDNNKER
ncbi:MAG: YopN family type secretion system gatekeeper subunit [Herbaspirillum sp.]|nr:YopN family type secretion system gatekeeper subunit [Herbaspirillum sp.]